MLMASRSRCAPFSAQLMAYKFSPVACRPKLRQFTDTQWCTYYRCAEQSRLRTLEKCPRITHLQMYCGRAETCRALHNLLLHLQGERSILMVEHSALPGTCYAAAKSLHTVDPLPRMQRLRPHPVSCWATRAPHDPRSLAKGNVWECRLADAVSLSDVQKIRTARIYISAFHCALHSS